MTQLTNRLSVTLALVLIPAAPALAQSSSAPAALPNYELGGGIVVMAARTPAEAQQPGVEVELGGGFHVPISQWIDSGLIELPDGPVVNVGVVRWGEKWGVSARVLAGFGGAVRLDDGPVVGGHYQGRYAHPTYIQLFVRYRTEQGIFFGVGGGVDGIFGPHIGIFEVLKSIGCGSFS